MMLGFTAGGAGAGDGEGAGGRGVDAAMEVRFGLREEDPAAAAA